MIGKIISIIGVLGVLLFHRVYAYVAWRVVYPVRLSFATIDKERFYD